MTASDEARRKAKLTYDAAADTFDHPANAYWDRYGRATVERLRLPPDARVLDVCCGSGASALPAAEAVGSGGAVLGIDLSANLLALARAKASARGVRQAEFRLGDMLDLGLPGDTFDAVVCVFGIFFVPDMSAAVRELWRVVRPGGRLALTTWGPRLFEPLESVFWRAVRERRPDLYRGFNPWSRLSEPELVRGLFAARGVSLDGVVVEAEAGRHALRSPGDGWAIVMGSGYRGTVEQLTPFERDEVRLACEEFLLAKRVAEIETNVVYAVARKA
jgi:ubiquinone/menaquinone biosynthesis C-methylase UbiE